MTEQERKELCSKCKKCDKERLEKQTEGCPSWYNDRIFGGCSEFVPKKQTNADRIRSMTDWELAEFIHSVSCGQAKISVCEEECENCEKTDSWCISNIGEWLQTESEE